MNARFLQLHWATYLTAVVASGSLPAAAPVPEREWVTLRGSVVFAKEYAIPAAREIVPGRQQPALPECCTKDGRKTIDEKLLIDPKTRGIRNVVVWLRPDSPDRKVPFPQDRIHPGLRDPKPKDHAVRAVGCQFQPRVLIARSGDTLQFHNDMTDPVNVRYNAAWDGDPLGGVAPFNRVLPAGAPPTPAVTLRPYGRAPSRYVCDLYTWMTGSVWTFDHPYAAVTDANGRFELRDVPVGNWRLVVWHEVGGYPTADRPGPVGRRIAVGDTRNGATDLGVLPFESPEWADPD